MSLAERLVAPQIRALQPYQSARRIGGVGQVYLNANEAAWPPFQMPEGETWNRYPDFLPNELAARYARYAGIPPDHALAVRGADEAIDLLVRTFCAPGDDRIRLQNPTYSMYDFVARAHGVGVDAVALADDFSLALEANCADAADERLKLVFVCHPNNPTGNPMDVDALRALIAAHQERSLVVVDEAYIEYCEAQSVLPLLAEFPNLVVIRTLSKAFALAAVRVGFLLAHPEVLAQVRKLIAPYPIPDNSAGVALEALSSPGVAYMHQQRDRALALRSRLQAALNELPAVTAVCPSATNFLLVRFTDAGRVMQSLKSAGIIVRDQTHFPRLPQHLRITVGTEDDLEQLIDHLRTVAA